MDTMTTRRKEAPLATRSDGQELIRAMNENDVMCGRGLAVSKFIGNIRFHELVDSRREEYVAIASYNAKAVIAVEVHDEILRRGGRFLQLIVSTRNVSKKDINNTEDAVCEVVDEKVSMEKCKQALREKPKDERKKKKKKIRAKKSPKQTKSQRKRGGNTGTRNSNAGACGTDFSSPLGESEVLPATRTFDSLIDEDLACLSPLPAPFPEIGPPADVFLDFEGIELPEAYHHAAEGNVSEETPSLSLSASSGLLPTTTNDGKMSLDTRLGLNQLARHSSLQQSLVTKPQLQSQLLHIPAAYSSTTTVPLEPMSMLQGSVNASFSTAYQSSVANTMPHSRFNGFAPLDAALGSRGTVLQGIGHLPTELSRRTGIVSTTGATDSWQGQPIALDNDISECFLSALGLGADVPRFTQQDEIQEQAALTEEERTAIVTDMFGDKCSIDEHQSKRTRRSFDDESVSFLVKEMRAEMERIPATKKKALVEAQCKCQPEEFCDSRLEKFLRADGMNAELAAHRFVKYWEERKAVFGLDKFCLRMTLSEALRDDAVALQAGVFSLLPNRDLSGRHLMYVEPHRLAYEGYDADSMVRAIWYLMEITVQEGSCGFVAVTNEQNATLFDFDRKVFFRTMRLYNNCWPTRNLPTHACCPSKALLRMLKPVAFAFVGKEARTRYRIHDVPPSEIVESLTPYGITRGMLPMQLGGSIQLDPAEWLASRRAIEMEEIL